MLNFDHNATHPLSAVARQAWLDAVERFPGNPSSPHRWGGRASAALEEARETVAGWLGCSPAEIVWTSGATEANNALLHHLGEATGGGILVSSLEHPSVRMACRRWLHGRTEAIPALRDGRVDLDWVRARLARDGVGAVVVMAANNETGVLQPVEELQELCAARGVPLAVDAAQWIGKLPARRLAGIGMLSACAHKFGGPQGVGFLRGPESFQALLVGGPQEEGRRAGTENVAGILSLVAALAERERTLGSAGDEGAAGGAGRQAWRDRFIVDLKEAVPGVHVLGETVPRLWNTVAVLLPAPADCRRRWVAKLDRLGVAASTGSACASGKEQPSAVLAAMGYQPGESDRMVRFSAGWETPEAEWTALLDVVRRAAVALLGER